MSTTDEYWLEQWIKEYEIASVADYQRAIRSPTVIKSLYEKIPPHGHERQVKTGADNYTVMAGRSLDLSASFSPPCFTCLRGELERVVTRTAHYFEKVAVSGPVGDIVARGLQAKDKDERIRTLRNLQPHVALVNYINRVGVRNRTKFITKPAAYCDTCYANAARDAGITFFDDEDQRREIITQLISTSNISTVRNRSGNWVARVSGPMVPGTEWSHQASSWFKEYGRKRPTRETIAESLFFSLAYPTVQDLISSKRYRLPVVDMFEMEWADTRKAGAGPVTANEIALRVELPAIIGVELQDFIRLEQDESSSFVKFQAALRMAIREALDRHESEAPEAVGRAVIDEYIRPEIADIERKLNLATRSLAKKVGASVVVGATVTSIGLVTAIPLIATLGLGAAATWLPQLYKFYDDKASVESSDMYFLWKLGRIKHEVKHARS